MPFRAKASFFVAFLIGLVLTVGTTFFYSPQPLNASPVPIVKPLNLAKADQSVLTNLAELPNIPIKNFPDFEVTQELLDQLDSIGSSASKLFQVGESVKPADILMIGNFDLFGLPQLSLDKIGGLADFDLKSLPLDDISQLLENLTPANLLEIAGLENLYSELLSDVPLLKELTDKFPALVGNLGTENPLNSASVGQVLDASPQLKDTPFSNLAPEDLSKMTIGNAVPGLTSVPLQNIPGSETLPIGSLSGAGLTNLSLSQMPMPLALVPGIRLGVADIALGDAGSGSQEQSRLRVVSGGIRNKDLQMTGARCPDDSCPHFEISTGDPLLDGAAWMDSTGQRVPDGFGPLCMPFSCKGPPGNHPFGPGVRVLLRDIDQAEGTAQVAFSFPVCKVIPFIGKTCTPWMFPIPQGLPIATIAEKSVVPFVVPIRTTDGEVASVDKLPPG